MKKYLIATALLAAIFAGSYVMSNFNMASLAASRQQANDTLLRETMAEHVGVLAYLYGYPLVDMAKQMHNETHRVTADQQVIAPVNRFYRFPDLVTPETQGNFRAPNSDTLYYTAWFDISKQPVIIHTPDTKGRYFTIAVTNQYAEVEHIGRRTTGTAQRYTALVAPDWDGDLPAGVHRLEVETPKGWLLGRMLVDDKADFKAAYALVEQIWMAALDEFEFGAPPSTPRIPTAAALSPLENLEFFRVMNEAMQTLPPRPGETALLEQFRQIGIGKGLRFDPGTLDEVTKSGLQKALGTGSKMVAASRARTVASYNGWMVLDNIGRYGFNYLDRASVVAGGYGNLPEESLYPAKVFDDQGRMLEGKFTYRLQFPAGELPPVDGFWSLSVYRLSDLSLVSNPIERYSIGSRTKGLVYAADGALTITLSHKQPPSGIHNWMPVPDDTFMLVMRLYEPRAEALSYQYRLPGIERAN